MTLGGHLQLGLYLVVLLALVQPLGAYMARVYSGQPVMLAHVLGGLERLVYRLAGVRPDQEMDWRSYAVAVLLFNGAGMMVLYLLLRVQGWLPLNPHGFGGVAPDLAFNTAASFTSNTNWQAYGGETTLSHFTQMLGLTAQNFASAATGMACLAALIRGLARCSAGTIGNFWTDLTRTILYIFLPLALVGAVVLVPQGVVQTFSSSVTVELVQPVTHVDARTGRPTTYTEQTLAVGPAASQVIIKQLGTNGGGFFNTNSAHPFENPTALSAFVELLAILLVPAALCHTFGVMVGDTRQGWAVLAAMTLLFVIFLGVCAGAEQRGHRYSSLGVDHASTSGHAGGNMEGKEVRFGIVLSALWATATTAASNGSVNSMHDSYTPVGGLVPMWLMQLGEVVYGGVGSGLYGMLAFVIVAVFVAGLMVGRTPEYLGKKIQAYEMKMAALVILIPPALVLVGTAAAVLTPSALAARQDGAAHGFSEILYAYSSMGNNNGSAFAGYGADTPYVNVTGGVAMLVSRFALVVPVLALAGSLARKVPAPSGPGTLPTHTPLFVGLLVGVVVMVGALSFIPALALGPIVEHLTLTAGQ